MIFNLFKSRNGSLPCIVTAVCLCFVLVRLAYCIVFTAFATLLKNPKFQKQTTAVARTQDPGREGNCIRCFQHTPLAATLEVQPSIEHVPSPPCLLQLPPHFRDGVVQSGTLQNPNAPCLMHSPRACTLLLHPSVAHNPFPPCVPHFPLLTANVLQSGAEQTPFAPCRWHTPRPLTFEVHPENWHTFGSPLPPLCLEHNCFRLAFESNQSMLTTPHHAEHSIVLLARQL